MLIFLHASDLVLACYSEADAIVVDHFYIIIHLTRIITIFVLSHIDDLNCIIMPSFSNFVHFSLIYLRAVTLKSSL